MVGQQPACRGDEFEDKMKELENVCNPSLLRCTREELVMLQEAWMRNPHHQVAVLVPRSKRSTKFVSILSVYFLC